MKHVLMKLSTVLMIASVLILAGCPAKQSKLESTIFVLTENGRGTAVGTVVVEPVEQGTLFRVNLKSPLLKIGEIHPFHVHEFGNLAAKADANGILIIGGSAGGHWDPDNTGRHAGPNGDGHRGDLPSLRVNNQSEINMQVVAKRIKNVSNLKGKSLIIHDAEGPDRIFGAVL